MPLAIQKYLYRKLFGLSAQELADEPVDDFFTNLKIYSSINKKQELMNKHSGGK
jgi:hypothetical protein